MLLNEDLVQDSSLLKPKRKKYLTEGRAGWQKSMELTVIKEVRLGPYKSEMFLFTCLMMSTTLPHTPFWAD